VGETGSLVYEKDVSFLEQHLRFFVYQGKHITTNENAAIGGVDGAS
jgi:hypothetical protein